MLKIPNSINPVLLQSHKTHHAMIEFTRDCNMRCTYCAVSQPNWNPVTLDLKKIDFDKIISALKSRSLNLVILHGHGETTMIKGWHLYAKKFQDVGISLTTCTNLAREYSIEELDILSQFHSITVSLDTIDPSLFRKIRRGGDIRQIMFNQARIKALAKAKNHDIMWVWSCVVLDKTISGLLDLVYYGLSIGVKVFCFCNLTEMPTPEGGVDVHHISKLSDSESKEALKIMRKAKRVIEKNGAIFDAKAGLMDTLKARVNACS